MTESPPDQSPSRSLSREVVIVAVLTGLGAIVRLWGLKTLGLVHFDEGIYALAGLWSISPGGLAALDPPVIAYAPPGFPFLVGISYLFFGVSDLAAILVSVVAGALTIPATAWLARRTFGAGAGACAAALVAFSGFHVAFSRMALTDAPFLLFWVLGMISAQRFLERPGIARAIILGLSVGVAQLFKYNGWLIGAIVVLTAGVGLILDPRERTRARVLTTWGSGLLAAVVAAAVYWPWFRFVESHGGYGRLLAHHQSYLGGAGSWLSHLRLQIEQAEALSGGPIWNTAAFMAAVLCLRLVRPPRSRNEVFATALSALLLDVVILMMPQWYWLIPAVWILLTHLAQFREGEPPAEPDVTAARREPRTPGIAKGYSRRKWTPGMLVLGGGWYLLSVLTPFYHPYARLWLPLQLTGWVVMGAILSGAQARSRQTREPGGSQPAPVASGSDLMLICFQFLIVVGCIWVMTPVTLEHPKAGLEPRISPVIPTDSLRNAVGQAVSDLPPDTTGLRLLVRPPVTFYLGGRVPAQVEPNLDRLMVSANPNLLALVDVAQLRQEGDLKTATEKLLSRWEIVHEYPTQLNLPTLLDIDTGAARSGRSEALDAPLWLLRPRRGGPPG